MTAPLPARKSVIQRVLGSLPSIGRRARRSNSRCRRAFLRLHTLEFLGQPLADSSIARLIWDITPECGILFGAPVVAAGAVQHHYGGWPISTTQMLLEFAEPLQLSQFVSKVRAHMAPFLAEVESVPASPAAAAVVARGWGGAAAQQQLQGGGWRLESIACCPIRDDQQWSACMFHLCATDREAPQCHGGMHYENESLLFSIANPCCPLDNLSVPNLAAPPTKKCHLYSTIMTVLPVKRSELEAQRAAAAGEHAFTLPHATYKEFSRLLQLSREVAGTIDLHWDTMELSTSSVKSGARNHVQFPQAHFSFHTHPWSCPSAKPSGGTSQCFIDVPSPEDVAGVIKCSLRKPRTVAHFVVTFQGCYMIAVPSHRLHRFPAATAAAVSACERLFASLDGKGHLTAGERQHFRHAWLRCMREHGVAAKYFAHLQDLKLTLHVT